MKNISYGPKTAKEWYKQVREGYNDFLRDDTDFYKANCVCTFLWHMTDWTFKEQKSSKQGYKNLGDFRDMLYESCNDLKLLCDIANSCKHGELKIDRIKVKDAQESKATGSFSSDFSSDFDNHRLVVQMENGDKHNLLDILEKVVIFWDEYFKKHIN